MNESNLINSKVYIPLLHKGFPYPYLFGLGKIFHYSPTLSIKKISIFITHLRAEGKQ